MASLDSRIVGSSASDCLERLVPEMTNIVLNRTLFHSLDSRIVGSATAVNGSSAAFVNAARYDVAVLATPAAVCRAKRS